MPFHPGSQEHSKLTLQLKVKIRSARARRGMELLALFGVYASQRETNVSRYAEIKLARTTKVKSVSDSPLFTHWTGLTVFPCVSQLQRVRNLCPCIQWVSCQFSNLSISPSSKESYYDYHFRYGIGILITRLRPECIV